MKIAAVQMVSTSSVAQCGVSLDGLNTIVFPVTRAGIIFQHGMAIGKFHGVMIPATPIGWRMLIAHLSGSSEGVVSPNIRRPSPAMRKAARRRRPRRGLANEIAPGHDRGGSRPDSNGHAGAEPVADCDAVSPRRSARR